MTACSKCGSCLAACAVYQLVLEESASPRGRLAILDALRDGSLDDTVQNRRFLEACLLCGRCEAVCQKGVKGKEEIWQQRSLWWAEQKTPQWKRILTRFYGPRLLKMVRPFLRLLALTPLRKHLLLPKTLNRTKRYLGAEAQSDMAIFPGCVLGVFYPDLIRGIENILMAAGHPVSVLWQADCCGYPALSQGDLKTFAKRKSANQQLFSTQGIKHLILPCATGAAALKAHYDPGLNISELGTFMATACPDLTVCNQQILQSPAGFWLFHRPCHQPQRSNLVGWMKELSKCKQIRTPAREETDCCGFGGIFSVGFAHLSRGILLARQAEWRRQGVGGIITDCPGCYMQFREAGELPVLFFTEVFTAASA